MNQIAKRLTLYSFFLVCFLSFSTSLVWAQENTEPSSETKSTTTTSKTTDINVTTDSDTWYTQPWVWIAGAAVFILLLVALLSSGRGKDTTTTRDRITVKKTVERDTGSDV
jgi:hypothetical protein